MTEPASIAISPRAVADIQTHRMYILQRFCNPVAADRIANVIFSIVLCGPHFPQDVKQERAKTPNGIAPKRRTELRQNAERNCAKTPTFSDSVRDGLQEFIFRSWDADESVPTSVKRYPFKALTVIVRPLTKVGV